MCILYITQNVRLDIQYRLITDPAFFLFENPISMTGRRQHA